MRVLITGGAGFVGSHLADACLLRGDEVYVLDTGDSIHFKSTRPHAYAAVGDSESIVFMACCPKYGL